MTTKLQHERTKHARLHFFLDSLPHVVADDNLRCVRQKIQRHGMTFKRKTELRQKKTFAIQKVTPATSKQIQQDSQVPSLIL
jgi:hypothetical protein